MPRKLLAVISFVAIYNFLFYKSGVGIITFLFFLTLHILLYLLRSKESKNQLLALASSTVAVLTSFYFTYSSNGFLAVVNLGMALFSTLAAYYFYQLGTPFRYSLTEYVLVPVKSGISFIEGVVSVPKLSQQARLPKVNNASTSSVARGVLFAIPILVVLFFLFNIADPIYSKFTLDLVTNFQQLFMGPMWERIVHSLVVLIVCLAILASFLKVKTENHEESEKTINKERQIEIITFLVLPVLLFFSFLIVQFEYLFTNMSERQLAEIGITSLTYSEYVRRGFIELLIASGISLGIVGFISRFVHRIKNRHEIVIKGLIATLILQTQVLLFSVFWRVVMYQMEHGLTRNRVFGMYILVAFSCILFLYLAKVMMNIKQRYLFLGIAAIGFLTLTAMTISNPDRLIAVNFHPTVNERVDNYYISKLSYDAVDGWKDTIIRNKQLIDTYQTPQSVASNDDLYHLQCARLSVIILKEKVEYLNNKYQSDGIKNWRELNISEYNAFQKVNSTPEFTQISTLIDRVYWLLTERQKLNNNQHTYFAECGSY